MDKESRKNRLNPSKLLVLLLYGTYPYLETTKVGKNKRTLNFKIGPFARLLRVKNLHVLEYLDWLDTMNYISLDKCTTGLNARATVTIELPARFREDI